MTHNASNPAPRRRFLKKAATGAAAAGALAAPMVSRAQTTSLRFQTTWPSKDIFHEYANDFAKKVNDMAGGRLKIEVLPSGSVVARVPGARGREQGHARRRARRRRLPLRQEHRARAVGLGPGVRHGPEHGARVAQLRRRQGAAGGDLQVHQHGRGVVPVRPDAHAAAGLVQEAGGQGRGHEGPEVPHRRPRRWTSSPPWARP